MHGLENPVVQAESVSKIQGIDFLFELSGGSKIQYSRSCDELEIMIGANRGGGLHKKGRIARYASWDVQLRKVHSGSIWGIELNKI